MHASETISLVYPEPLNLQDQKVSAMNSDLLNPCPIYCLNSAQTSKQTLSLFVPPAVRFGLE